MGMKDLSKEIMAYALQNAIEYGKANAGKVLPKLFQHGLKKEDIKQVMPLINEAVKKINSMKEDERKKAFEDFEKVVKHREEKEKDLMELPNIRGKPVFRLAPEPSKYLHIGHALTYLLNYLYAKRYKGKCKLRFEDCNPEKVNEEYVKSNLDDIKDYLGIKVDSVRYVSDDMKKMYSYAEKIIKAGKAYVCHCSQEELRKNRAEGVECGCRQLPPKIQIFRWKDMFKEKEGDAVLRIKGDMQSKNFVMRDSVIFRIIDKKHFRQGNKYRIWPMYDFYNPIEDSLMGVTHILRSNEFDLRVELQDYIKELLKLKKQTIVQYGRFNVIDATTKGREIRELVGSGEYIGWDDPRLVTLKALRRRGITREAYYELAKQLGLSKNQANLDFNLIASINRKIIDKKADRHFFVKNPVELTVENNPGIKYAEMPVHPDRDEKRRIELKKLYISGEDFEKYRGTEVRLLHLFNVNLNGDKSAKVTSIDNKDIDKIQWVSNNVMSRILMPDGKWTEGIAESGIKNVKKDEVIQFERFGFCRLDKKNKDFYEFWFAHE